MIRILAVTLGAVWFLPVSCATGMFITYPLVTKSHERHMSKGNMPHSLSTRGVGADYQERSLWFRAAQCARAGRKIPGAHLPHDATSQAP